MANESKTSEIARRKPIAGGHLRKGEREAVAPSKPGTVSIKAVRQGLPVKVFKTLAVDLEMGERQLAAVLKIPNRTLDRRLKEGVLSPEESDRVARVARILGRANEVFGNAEKARGWMNTRLAAFDSETPLERADTSLGATQVEDVLGRIDYGVYT